MNNRKFLTISSQTLLDHIFTIFNIICLIGVFFRTEKVGALCSCAIMLVILLNGHLLRFLRRDVFFSFFIIFNIVSVFWYLFNGYPTSVFFSAISYNVIPSLLYLFGADAAQRMSLEDSCSKVLKVCLFIIAFGLVFYIFNQDFYFKYIDTHLDGYKWGTADYRFGSYISSSNMGSMCVSCITLLFICMQNARKKLYYVVGFLLVAISLILCMQRSSWVVSCLAIVVFVVRMKIPKQRKLYIIIIGIFLMVGIFVFRKSIFSDEQLLYFTTRFSSLNMSRMLGERMNQINASMKIIWENPLGVGLGSLGHKSAQIGYGVVCDNNYLRILGEIGWPGFILFICMVIKALRNSLVFGRFEMIVLIASFMLQAIGTNVFDLFFSSFIFWYYLGFSTYYKKDIIESTTYL